MLTIDHEVKKSEIHGLGLFTKEDITKNQVIGKLNKFDFIIPIHEIEDEFLEHFNFYCSKQGDTYQTYFDNMRFMNHSDNPNCIDLPNGDCVAIMDIKKGKELTCDYSLICDDWKK